MSFFTNDISEQYLTKLYDDLQKENTKLLNELKGDLETAKEKEITKQIAIINNLTLSVIKLKNLRKKINTDT